MANYKDCNASENSSERSIDYEFQVQLTDSAYPILIGRGLVVNQQLDSQQLDFRRLIPSKQVMVVTDDAVAPLYLQDFLHVFNDRQCESVILKQGEKFKNFDNLNRIYDALIEGNHHRETTLVALGGGVVGDMTGFAAATFQRGVSFVQVPTTLLAQVDASVGGKTGINHPNAKNMIGAFYQPRAVIMDLNTLKTLPLREFRAGLGEVIKYALLEGGDFLSLLHRALLNGLADNQAPELASIIAQCCQAKIRFIEADEREQGSRALLNLGHTFAHALETATHYERWLHGEAVAIGLYCATLLSYEMGLIEQRVLSQVDELLHLAQLPRRIPDDLDLHMLRQLMMNDKKVKNNQLRLILLHGFGHCYIEEQINEDKLLCVLEKACEGE